MTDLNENSVVESGESGEGPEVASAPTPAAASEQSVESAAAESPEAPEAVASEDPAEATPSAPERPVNPNWKWYIVNSHRGYETVAKQALTDRVAQAGMEELFGEILVPTQDVVRVTKAGVKRRTTERFFPGYMLVQMELTDETWHMVNGTPKVSGFVGGKKRPPAVRQREVDKLRQSITEGTLQVVPTISFVEGEEVRIVDGQFANFAGTVEDFIEEQKKVTVLIPIFGRPTPVKLDVHQVEKV